MAAGLTLGTAFGSLQSVREALRAGAGGAALGVFAIRVAASGLGYAAQVLAARLMGFEAYGIYAVAWAWTAVLGHTLTLGLSQGACRFLPAAQARCDLDGARGFLAAGAGLTAAASLGVAILGLAVLLLAPALVAEPFWPALAVAACVLPVFAAQDYIEGVARSQGWTALAIAPPYLVRQGAMAAALLAAVVLGAPPRAEVAMGCMLAAAGLSTAVQAVLVARRLRPVIPPGPRRMDWRGWLSACLPIAAVDLAGAGFTFVDVMLLGALMPAAAIGPYFAATRIQQFVVFVHFAAGAATAQRYSAAHAVGDRRALADLVRRQGRATAAATALVGLGIAAAGPLLLGLFGSDFGPSVPALCVLVAGSVAATLFGPGEDILVMLGGERVCALVTVAALAAAVLLCLLLVPALGILGAALAMAAASVLRAAALACAAGALHGLATPVWSRAPR